MPYNGIDIHIASSVCVFVLSVSFFVLLFRKLYVICEAKVYILASINWILKMIWNFLKIREWRRKHVVDALLRFVSSTEID